VRDVLKLVRLALTAAIVTAIAVRLRRRARMTGEEPALPATAPESGSRRPYGRWGRRAGRRMGSPMGLVWAAIAAIVAVTLAAALVPTDAQQAAAAAWRRYQADQAVHAEFDSALPVSPPQPPTAAAQQSPQASAQVSMGSGQETAAAQWPAQSPAASVPASPVPDGQAGGSPADGIPDPRCSPVPRPVIVRAIDPRVARAVDGQWRRIERWLRANAPRTYRTLGAPGRARTIAVAESQMGVDFPDDLRASLLRHNGSTGLLGFGFGYDGAVNLGTREIRDAWRHLCRWDGTDAGTDPATEPWNGRMIPFLRFGDRDGADMAYAVVDSVERKVGWDDTISGMAPRLPSYYALMRTVADALEQGAEIDGRRPAVKRGVLRWDNVRNGNS
jgi:hypothetical protein